MRAQQLSLRQSLLPADQPRAAPFKRRSWVEAIASHPPTPSLLSTSRSDNHAAPYLPLILSCERHAHEEKLQHEDERDGTAVASARLVGGGVARRG